MTITISQGLPAADGAGMSGNFASGGALLARRGAPPEGRRSVDPEGLPSLVKGG